MIKKIIYSILAYIIPLVLFHLIFYRFELKLEYISNSLFYIGIFSFIFGLVSITNAQNVFIGFRYYMSQLFKRNKLEEKLSYSEYKEDKYNSTYTYKTVVLLVVGIVLIISSLIISQISMK